MNISCVSRFRTLAVIALLWPATLAAQTKPKPAGATVPSTAKSAQPLPGGANSVEEAHGDWRVACARPDGQMHCSLSQQMLDRDSHQRIVAIELTPHLAGGTEGTLVLPFGLALDQGVTLQIDDGPVSPAMRFRTCLPAGCVVVLTLDNASITNLKTGRLLVIKAVGDNTQNLAFPMSLKGFAGAFDRTTDLSK
jgi:invasion protein IalB